MRWAPFRRARNDAPHQLSDGFQDLTLPEPIPPDPFRESTRQTMPFLKSAAVPVSGTAPHRVLLPDQLIGFVPTHRFHRDANVALELKSVVQMKRILRRMPRMHRDVTGDGFAIKQA